MNLDRGTQFDLEEVEQMRQNAKTVAEKERYERMMFKMIKRINIRELRERLIRAMRVNDTVAIKYISGMIKDIQIREQNGYERNRN